MSRRHDFDEGVYFDWFLRGVHEERTEPNPPNDQEPDFVRDSDDTPKDFL